MVKRTLALNPNPPPGLNMSYFLGQWNGRYEAALTEVQRTEIEDCGTPRFRAAVYGQLGRLDEARVLRAAPAVARLTRRASPKLDRALRLSGRDDRARDGGVGEGGARG